MILSSYECCARWNILWNIQNLYFELNYCETYSKTLSIFAPPPESHRQVETCPRKLYFRGRRSKFDLRVKRSASTPATGVDVTGWPRGQGSLRGGNCQHVCRSVSGLGNVVIAKLLALIDLCLLSSIHVPRCSFIHSFIHSFMHICERKLS